MSYRDQDWPIGHPLSQRSLPKPTAPDTLVPKDLRYGTPEQRAEADRLLAAITDYHNEQQRLCTAWNDKANNEGEHEAHAELDAIQQHHNEHGDCTDNLLHYIRLTGALPTGWPEHETTAG